MDGFYQQGGEWHADGVSLAAIADAHGTPCYVYSHSALHNAYHHIKNAFCHSTPTVCYAVKANDNLAVLSVLDKLGASFDIVSGGELARVLKAGGAGKNIVFSGVGKTSDEINAALNARIGMFNVESAQELHRIEACAANIGRTAPVAIRISYNIDGKTHEHLTTGLTDGKFGVTADDGIALATFTAKSKWLNFRGYSCHIGSQIVDENTYLRLVDLVAEQLHRTENEAGIPVACVDMGGGFAVDDQQINPPPPALLRYDKKLADLFDGKKIIIEPGRSIVATAGVLLTRVQYEKAASQKTIWITDAGMNNLLRPALYGATLPVTNVSSSTVGESFGDIAGPVCESADILAKNRQLTATSGDLLAVFNTGAYGMVMESNYNARPRTAAVMTANGKSRLIRRTETIQDMLALECPPTTAE